VAALGDHQHNDGVPLPHLGGLLWVLMIEAVGVTDLGARLGLPVVEPSESYGPHVLTIVFQTFGSST
jgi:hypothetical protein